MKILPKVIKAISYLFFFVFLFLFSLASLNQIRAQGSVEIPGPDLEDAFFIPVKDLEIGDWVFVKDKTGNLIPEQITKLEYHQEEVEVYNLSVEGEETFFANDFAVHNKHEHDTVCDAIAVQKLSEASSEIWEWGGCTPVSGAIPSEASLCSAYSRAGFKNMFQYKRELMGANCPLDGVFGGGGSPLCLFGVPNFCTPFCGDSGMCRHCHPGRHVGCCGEKCPGPDCRCSVCSACSFRQAINQTCGEMTCGKALDDCVGCLDRIRHDAPGNGIRFRTNGWCDEDEGCGKAVKITAPAGFVIKTIEFNVLSYMQYWNDDRKSKLALSRGMAVTDWCTNPFDPMATIWEETKTGRQSWSSGKVNIGAQYIFLYFKSKGQYCCNDEGDCRTSWCKEIKDNFAEVTDIKVELVPINQKVSEVVTILNSSQLYYSACGLSGVCNWHTCNRGEMVFSAGGGWSSEKYSWTSNGPWTYDWTLPVGVTGLQNLLARVQCSASLGPTICPLGTREIVGPTGTITGRVFQNLEGKCQGTDPPPAEADWTVRCQMLDGSWEVADEDPANSQYTCVDSDGNSQLPYGNYSIRLTPPVEWQAIDCPGAVQDIYRSVVLDDTAVEVDDPFYIWQGLPAWFQIREGDAHGEGGVYSDIPAGEYFCLLGDGGTPGVVSYGEESGFDFKNGTGLGDDRVSETEWLVDTTLGARLYNYFYHYLGSPEEDTFESLGSLTEDGVYYNPEGIDISDNFPGGGIKAVVLVNGDVNINNNLTIPEDGSSLVLIVNGNVNIADSVSEIHGIFIADSIDTGTGTTPFIGYGSFIANNFTLGRDDETDLEQENPYESFYYRPDLMINSLEDIWIAPYTWQEIAP